jgi:hypothetical protein
VAKIFFLSTCLEGPVLLLVSFSGFLRRSEAAALLLSDLEFAPGHIPQAIMVRVRKSKTDTLQRGMSFCLAWSTASGFLIGVTLQLYVTMLVQQVTRRSTHCSCL